jgi:hypothetical protein
LASKKTSAKAAAGRPRRKPDPTEAATAAFLSALQRIERRYRRRLVPVPTITPDGRVAARIAVQPVPPQ